MSVPSCLVCQRPVRAPEPSQDQVVWDCPGCGFFSVPAALQGPVDAALREDAGLRPRLSRVLRLAADGSGEGHVEPLLSGSAGPGELGTLLRDRASIVPFPRTVAEKLDVALLRIAALSSGLGDVVALDGLAAFGARLGLLTDAREQYLGELSSRGLVYYNPVSTNLSKAWALTASGWARVEALQNGLPDSTLVFLALSNRYVADGEPADPLAEGPKLRDAIAAALPAPLSAYRVENDHSAVDITDEIVANIRRARFVVADLTCARPNVYFEAGLAMGLGKPVVFTRRAGETAHFDVAAYKIIEWAPGDLGDFTAALKNHLVARALIPAV